MISHIGLKDGQSFNKLPKEVSGLLKKLFSEFHPADFEVWVKFGAIDAGKENYVLFVPFMNDFVKFSKKFFDTKDTLNNPELEKRYNGQYYKTHEGKRTLERILDRYAKKQEKETEVQEIVGEVTSTGSVGGSYEVAFPASKEDMKELEALKRNPHKMYVENDNDKIQEKMANKDQNIVEEITVAAFKQIMVEKYVYDSPAAKESAKNATKEVERKSMPKKEKSSPKKENELVDSKNRRLTDEEKLEAHQNGQTDIRYDGISDKARENNEENLKHGDGGEDGLWAGENYSDPKLGEKMAADAKKRNDAQREKDAQRAGVSVGDDFESVPQVGVVSRKHGFKESKNKKGNILAEVISIEDTEYRQKLAEKGYKYFFYNNDGNLISKSKNNPSALALAKRTKGTKLATRVVEVMSNEERTFNWTQYLSKNGFKLEEENQPTMKKYMFKNQLFESAEDAVDFVPQKAKLHENVFLMEDSENNSIKFEWIGNKDEGSVRLLEEKFPKRAQLLENKRENLSNYDSEKTLGKTNLNEDNFFFDMFGSVNENVESEKKTK
jgi:hypothetical protein